MAGAVQGSLVTWFVLPPGTPAGSAGKVNDGTTVESGPDPSRSAGIFVSRATGARPDQKLRTYVCNRPARRFGAVQERGHRVPS
jgi:hypothetical protein